MAAIGCDGAEPGEASPDAAPAQARATWHQDVAPIVHRHCVSCHQPGGIGPFSLKTFIEGDPIAGLMLENVESGAMPPWHATDSDDCAPRHGWEDDPRLSAADIETLRVWVEDGAALGDPETAAPLPQPPTYELELVTDTLQPDEPYTTTGYTDEQVCFVLDPSIDRVKWLEGMHIRPGNLQVAHHAVLSAIPPENADAVRALGGDNGTFDCFSSQGLEGAYTLGVWVPGARPFQTPAGSGIPMAPGTIMVLNLHYHPTGFSHEPDLTTVDLQLTTQAPEKTFFLTALGNAPAAPQLLAGPNDRGIAEFRIPAGMKGHTEKMVFDIETEDPRRFPMTALFPHMHYVGVGLEAKIIRANPAPGEPKEECLINIPRWDFDWQRTYFYDAELDRLPTIANGDRIEISCSYDNTTDNPFVVRMLEEEGLSAPIDVLLGDETTDEMCLIGVGLVF